MKHFLDKKMLIYKVFLILILLLSINEALSVSTRIVPRTKIKSRNLTKPVLKKLKKPIYSNNFWGKLFKRDMFLDRDNNFYIEID